MWSPVSKSDICLCCIFQFDDSSFIDIFPQPFHEKKEKENISSKKHLDEIFITAFFRNNSVIFHEPEQPLLYIP